MTLNERISKVIEYSKLSSSEFADAIDVPRSSISHIASGRNKPSLDFLIKVKEHFPELEWDWIITGNGEMKKKDSDININKEEPPKKETTSLPDLFTLIDDENFGKDEIEEQNLKNHQEQKIQTSRESSIPQHNTIKPVLDDSQQLEQKHDSLINQKTDNQESKVKRIVLFYENGKFESFEP